MNSFIDWLKTNEATAVVSTEEKINHIAKRISSYAMAMSYQAEQKGRTYDEFKSMPGNFSLHQPALYNYIVTRYSGREQKGDLYQGKSNVDALQNMINNMLNIQLPPNVEYVKGAGWAHYIVNGDSARRKEGTDKSYVGVQWRTLEPKAAEVWTSILNSLQKNNFKGQIKFLSAPMEWANRFDNFVIHSGSPEWAQFGAKIVKAVLEKFGVKTGGMGTTGDVETGLDVAGTGTSFNDYASEQGMNYIRDAYKTSNSYDEFRQKIKNAFSPTGPFVSKMMSILQKSI